MSIRSRQLAGWILRALGLALVAWVLITQVRWEDEIVLADGTVIRGEVVRTDDAFTVTDGETGRVTTFDVGQVAVREYGGRKVPHITYGFPTLGRRLGKHIPLVLIAYVGMTLLVVITALRWHLLVRVLGLQMRRARSIRLTFIGGFFNLAVPGSTGGDVVKAYYAARTTGAATKSVLSVFVDRFVGLFALVLFSAVVLFLTSDRPGYEPARITVGIVLAAGVLGLLILESRRLRRALGLSALYRKLPFQRVLEEVRAAISLYRRHVPGLLVAMGLSLLNHAGFATACWLLSKALGIEGITLGVAMALVPVANLLSAIPLLPGGWGVGELAFAYFFGQVGVPATEAVGLSVIYRLMVLGVNLPGGLLWMFWRDHPSKERIAAEVEEVTAHVADDLEAAAPAD